MIGVNQAAHLCHATWRGAHGDGGQSRYDTHVTDELIAIIFAFIFEDRFDRFGYFGGDFGVVVHRRNVLTIDFGGRGIAFIVAAAFFALTALLRGIGARWNGQHKGLGLIVPHRERVLIRR
ncbi:hypothetical protein QYZ42_24965 [Vibrio parahaemolyticus]|nr:hypothetical protein [Vibrio parahaemolyticus]